VSRAPRPVASTAAHFDRPSEVAAHIATQSAVVIAGPDSDRSAVFAVAIAKAASSARRVAIGDLVGESAPIYSLAGGEDAPGITDCFRDGLSLSDVARPVPDHASLFVLPSGQRVRTDETLTSSERWGRLVRGFGEAGGLLVLVVPDHSRLLITLGEAGAVLLYGGPADLAPPGIPLCATIGAALPPRSKRVRTGGIAGWQVAAAAIGTVALAGGAAVAWTSASNAPDGEVVVAPTRRAEIARDTIAAASAPITVDILERTSSADAARAAEFVIQLVAANTASNANSLLADASREAALPAATVSVVTVRSGASGSGGSRAARWHKVMAGAWRDARTADSALADLQKRGLLRKGEGQVIRAPYGVLLADSASLERARAVMDVWRAKGVVPYALNQDDGTVRVYAGAFETIAQAATMTAMVQAAGGLPLVAYRTGRPD
jgi:cell division septation protein DedD